MIGSKKNLSVGIDKVNKKYVLHHPKPTLVERIFGNSYEHFYALKDINLEIHKGERVGLIGKNGSGKTTLLKIIAGVTNPTSGKLFICGRRVSLIDLDAGFHPDLNGRENILLNGMLLGIKKSELQLKLKSIIKFSGVGKFIDLPLHTYSSGMTLRLGFSIAVHSSPEILILDENLAVGDQEFREKSFNAVKNIISRGATLIVASHDLKFLNKMCDRIIWLDGGRVVDDGPNKKVISSYFDYFAKKR